MQSPNYELHNLRHQEMMQRAENQRRANELLTTRDNSKQNRGVISPALAQMGKTLSNIGDNLQERFGDLPETTTGAPYQPETA